MNCHEGEFVLFTNFDLEQDKKKDIAKRVFCEQGIRQVVF